MTMHFIPQAEIRLAAESAVAEHRRRILERMPGAEGTTSAPPRFPGPDQGRRGCGATHDDYTDAKERFWEPVLTRLSEPDAHS